MPKNNNLSLKLIHAVRYRPMLYNPALNEYKNTYEKKLVWQEVAKEIGGKDGETMIWKWKNLRDSYAKHLRSINSSDDEGSKMSNWQWASQMTFLDPYMRVVRDCTAPEEPERIERRKHHDEESLPIKQPKLRRNSDFIIPEDTNSLSSSSYREDVRYRTDEYQPDNTEEFRQHTCSEKIDKTDYLFLSYSDTFKKFSPRRQALLKLQMAKMFAEAELQEIDPIKCDVQEET